MGSSTPGSFNARSEGVVPFLRTATWLQSKYLIDYSLAASTSVQAKTIESAQKTATSVSRMTSHCASATRSLFGLSDGSYTGRSDGVVVAADNPGIG
jgi:hypothetical protein